MACPAQFFDDFLVKRITAVVGADSDFDSHILTTPKSEMWTQLRTIEFLQTGCTRYTRYFSRHLLEVATQSQQEFLSRVNHVNQIQISFLPMERACVQTETERGHVSKLQYGSKQTDLRGRSVHRWL